MLDAYNIEALYKAPHSAGIPCQLTLEIFKEAFIKLQGSSNENKLYANEANYFLIVSNMSGFLPRNLIEQISLLKKQQSLKINIIHKPLKSQDDWFILMKKYIKSSLPESCSFIYNGTMLGEAEIP